MSGEDEEIFREGLGYYAAAELKPAAIDLINKYSGNKLWVGCDCQPSKAISPRLWPVAKKGFRRNLNSKHTQHSTECEFNQDAVPAKRVRASFQRKTRSEGILKFRLATGFTEKKQDDLPPPSNKINRSTYRPGLARLLCELLTDAGVQEINPQDHFPGKARYDTMINDIMLAAANFEIAENRYLCDWIAVGLDGLPGLKRRIAAEQPENWAGMRPHGILICNIAEAGDKELMFDSVELDPLPVLGRIAVFGERNAKDRAPYLAICLVAKDDYTSSYPEVLRAYVHPCLNWSKWTLVDSKLERETVNRAQRCRFGLSKNKNISVKITKPLFDCNYRDPSEYEPVCIPDFLVELLGEKKIPTVVVETMGYTDLRYRNRKKRMREYFERIDVRGSGVNASMVYHDPTAFPDDESAHVGFYEELFKCLVELSIGG
ncbi:hypothetical protein [Agrobacterium sp. Azo12]|uniref:hypothetical protein n=1 Tax=Agrobacterium sp. Azo12 TaxID=3031129 RepID=UPI0023D7BEA2|nr:hypothetical protein [Agrobacterium sp. Azo12]MDO5897901.1 hypothetical protein [Agrobacterium sp. Azo12]